MQKNDFFVRRKIIRYVKGQIYFEKGTRSNFIVLKLIIKFDLLPFQNIFKNFLLILKIRLLSIHFINNFKRFV